MRGAAFAFVVLLAVATALPALAGNSSDSPDPAAVRAELRDILSQPEYNRNYEKSFLQKALATAGRRFKDVLAWFAEALNLRAGGGASRIASFVLSLLAIGAFVALVILVARRVSAVGGSRSGADAANELDYDLPSSQPLLRQAAKLADSGDYRGAFRCAYLASISHLDEARALRFERSRTNWEYLRELKSGGHDGPYNTLRPLTLEFDRKFYGRGECGEDDYRAAVSAYETISREVTV